MELNYGYLFDLDGVLVDTMESHFSAWRSLGEEIGVRLRDSELAEFRGVSRNKCLDSILNRTTPVSAEERQRILCRKNDLYLASLARVNHSIIVPRVPDLLARLKKNGIRLGVVSASRNARRILDQTNMTAFFDVISCGKFDGLGKPAPDQILSVADALGCAVERSVVFDDAPVGLEAAAAAGAMVIGIGPMARDFPGNHHWLETLSDVTPSILAKWATTHNTFE